MIKEIKFTDKALKQINVLLAKKDKGSFFRIAIKGGGCSGFQYEFTFDREKTKEDLSFENILIDKTSADLLKYYFVLNHHHWLLNHRKNHTEIPSNHHLLLRF